MRGELSGCRDQDHDFPVGRVVVYQLVSATVHVLIIVDSKVAGDRQRRHDYISAAARTRHHESILGKEHIHTFVHPSMMIVWLRVRRKQVNHRDSRWFTCLRRPRRPVGLDQTKGSENPSPCVRDR